MEKEKKPFYKRWWFIVIIALIIIAAIVNPDEETDNKVTDDNDTVENESDSEAESDISSEPDAEENNVDVDESKEVDERDVQDDSDESDIVIDTSMYEFSKDVKVTDAIDIKNYVSLIIEMNDDLSQGLAFQHATTQTYDFLQQEALEGADKVGINIILEGQKIAMYEVDMSEFKTNDEQSMAQLVLDASVMEMITPEVHEYTQNMDLTYKEE